MSSPGGSRSRQRDDERDAVEPLAITDFYGFETAEFTVGHGLFYAGHNDRWAVGPGADTGLR